MEEEINLLDYYLVLKKRWKVIFSLVFIATTVSIIISFQLPKIYQGKATIFVIQEQQATSLSLSQVQIALSGGGATGSDYLMALLQSDSVREKVISDLKLSKNKFFIGKKPKKINKDFLLRKLKNITEVEDNRKGSITVMVNSTNKFLAADISNCFLRILDNFIKTNASANRKFLEGRIKKVNKELTEDEENLRNFQKRNKTISIDKQADGLIGTYGSLKSQKIAEQILLEQIETVSKASGSIEDLVKLETEKISSRAKEQGLEENINLLEKQFQIMPNTALQMVRLTRKVRLQSIIFETLVQQLEVVKMQEVRDEAKFQVIDWAYPPERPYKPSKRMIVMTSGLLSLFFGVFLVFLLEYLGNIKNAPRPKA